MAYHGEPLAVTKKKIRKFGPRPGDGRTQLWEAGWSQREAGDLAEVSVRWRGFEGMHQGVLMPIVMCQSENLSLWAISGRAQLEGS